MAPTHNNYWWPSKEMRETVKDAPAVIVPGSSTAYREIESYGKTFRFMCDETSDLIHGAFAYDELEWHNQNVSVFPGGDCTFPNTINLILPKNTVLCSVGPALEQDFEVCYDDWDE